MQLVPGIVQVSTNFFIRVVTLFLNFTTFPVVKFD